VHYVVDGAVTVTVAVVVVLLLAVADLEAAVVVAASVVRYHLDSDPDSESDSGPELEDNHSLWRLEFVAAVEVVAVEALLAAAAAEPVKTMTAVVVMMTLHVPVTIQ
jgi:hypothetical protein